MESAKPGRDAPDLKGSEHHRVSENGAAERRHFDRSDSSPVGAGRDAPDLKGFEHRGLPGGENMEKAQQPTEPLLRMSSLESAGSALSSPGEGSLYDFG